MGGYFLSGRHMRFTKPATTLDQQIDLLIRRGMAVPDRDRARHYLAHLNYYRLAAYWLPFEADHQSHRFRPGTCLDDVVALYSFDRELRLLVMDAIERLEVSVRTRWAYALAHTHGPHAHLEGTLFRRPDVYRTCRRALDEELARSREVFVAHYREKYSTPPLPPLWAVVEVMSLGQLSKWVSNLRHSRDRQAIARVYGVDEAILTSFLHHLTIVRNICAHHGRLWNRRLGFRFRLPRRPPVLAGSLHPASAGRLYNTLTMLEYFMTIISPGHHWRERLLALLERNPQADPSAMGFPPDWRARPVWRDAS